MKAPEITAAAAALLLATASAEAVAQPPIPFPAGVYGVETDPGVPECGSAEHRIRISPAGIERHGQRLCKWVAITKVEPDADTKAMIKAASAAERELYYGDDFEAKTDCTYGNSGAADDTITYVISPRSKPAPHLIVSEGDNPEVFYLCKGDQQ